MKLVYKYLLIFIFLHFQVYSQTVKVLLAETNHSKPTIWLFESDHKFNLHVPNIKNPAITKNFSTLKVEVINRKIYLNGKIFKHDHLKLNPTDGPIAVNGNLYDGNFIISKHQDNIYLINQVELEDYICSVLKTESWPGWPKEVNKAFAIASRSYVLAQMLQARKCRLIYHIKNSNYHQTYSGLHNDINLKAAVLETKNIILGYEGNPILAMFDSCCGGVIPAHIEGFDFKKYPYLARTARCTHCKLVKIYSWQAAYSDLEFKKIIKNALPNIRSIKKIATEKDKAGTVKSLIIHGHKESHAIDARTMYALFKDIKSFSYSVCYNSDIITLDGTGFGHHLGLCQWGAREMINKGYSHREILNFYYPGAKFMKFKG